MSGIRAIVYGVGEMGSIAARLMREKGVDIVGAIARSDEKVGKDLGEVAQLGITTNVTVERDADHVLGSRAADIALIGVSSYMDDMFGHFKRCAENGINAASIAEEALYPWATSPMLTAELDRLAKEYGVTITGTGHQDAYWVNLVSAIMGTAHRIDSVKGRASWNVDDYGAEVAKDQRVGDTAEEFQRFIEQAERPPSFGRVALDALAADIGLTISSTENSTRPEKAEQDMYSKSLDTSIPAGRMIGFTDIDTAYTVGGPTLTFEMAGRIYAAGEADFNEWEIRGEPDLHLSNPRVPTSMTTCAQFVNRIPDVINAPPGYTTLDKLPKLRYRAFPLARYLR